MLNLIIAIHIIHIKNYYLQVCFRDCEKEDRKFITNNIKTDSRMRDSNGSISEANELKLLVVRDRSAP